MTTYRFRVRDDAPNPLNVAVAHAKQATLARFTDGYYTTDNEALATALQEQYGHLIESATDEPEPLPVPGRRPAGK